MDTVTSFVKILRDRARTLTLNDPNRPLLLEHSDKIARQQALFAGMCSRDNMRNLNAVWANAERVLVNVDTKPPGGAGGAGDDLSDILGERERIAA